MRDYTYIQETCPNLGAMELSPKELQDFCIELLVAQRKLQGHYHAQDLMLTRDIRALEEKIRDLENDLNALEAEFEGDLQDERKALRIMPGYQEAYDKLLAEEGYKEYEARIDLRRRSP